VVWLVAVMVGEGSPDELWWPCAQSCCGWSFGVQWRSKGVWCGVVWCGVVWCGVVWCGVVWCGVVWCAERRECLHVFRAQQTGCVAQ
jgi:hypothetical protein